YQRRATLDSTDLRPTIIAAVILPIVCLLACWQIIRTRMASRRRLRTEERSDTDLLAGTSEAEPEQIVDIREMTREGLTLSVVVLPADVNVADQTRGPPPPVPPRPNLVVNASEEEGIHRSEEEPEPESALAGRSEGASALRTRCRHPEQELSRVRLADSEQMPDVEPSSTSSRQNHDADGEEVNFGELLQVARENIEELERQVQSTSRSALDSDAPPGY
ncbi:hypothetical protein FB45DRAFT_938200, partial [Roridomyces roridus]